MQGCLIFHHSLKYHQTKLNYLSNNNLEKNYNEKCTSFQVTNRGNGIFKICLVDYRKQITSEITSDQKKWNNEEGIQNILHKNIQIDTSYRISVIVASAPPLQKKEPW